MTAKHHRFPQKKPLVQTLLQSANEKLQQALQLHQQGAVEKAQAIYQDILKQHPNHFDSLHLLGISYIQTGQPAKSLELIGKALKINPRLAQVHNNLGKAYKDLGQFKNAIVAYEKALVIKPDYAEAYVNRGSALLEIDRPAEALEDFDKALALNPNLSAAHINRGNALKSLLRLEEAIVQYNKALQLTPNSAEAYSNRGNVLKDLGRSDEALKDLDRAITLNPNYAEAYNNRGIVLRELNRSVEALNNFDQSLRLNPHAADVYNNRGNALKDIKRLPDALASYDKAISIKPDFADAYWNKSLLLILAGDYLNGWALYEWRQHKEDLKGSYYNFPQPAWRGQQDLSGKTLLVYAEQGFGDVIQFCRYLPQLHALGIKIVFEVPQPLVSLVSGLPCPMMVVAKGEQLPAFDAHCPVMSLPYAFKTALHTVPSAVPYIQSNASKVQEWQRKLGEKNRLRVGLVWSGSTAHKNDANRSVRLQDLQPLLDLSVEWHSLQKEYRQHDLEYLQRAKQINQHQLDLQDFSDTAALIECMDLVISVDTSVAHVAGALGKQVWILLPYAPDYRWMLERSDTPWYPTAKLFRQKEAGDWQGVVGKLVSECRSIII